MNFEKDYLYHIYNRSNETLFLNDNNYRFFLEKLRLKVYPVCEIFSWCLIPNHFHLLIQANEASIRSPNEKHRPKLQLLSKNIGEILSSYTQAINKLRRRKGSLFAHKTKAKLITHRGSEFVENCFHYIHRNPLEAGLVKRIEDWPYSSFADYAGLRNGTLCNKALAYKIINFNKDDFYDQSYAIIMDKIIKEFY